MLQKWLETWWDGEMNNPGCSTYFHNVLVGPTILQAYHKSNVKIELQVAKMINHSNLHIYPT